MRAELGPPRRLCHRAAGTATIAAAAAGSAAAAAAAASEHRAAASLAVEALAISYAQRLSLIACQACSALAASFVASCHEHLGAANAAWFVQVASMGYLAQVESLLTTRGDDGACSRICGRMPDAFACQTSGGERRWR